MVATFAIIHRPAYYTSQPSAYYTADKEAAGVWLRGNERLGIVQGSAVRPRDFDLLCEGCDTTSKKLVKTPLFKRRVLGVDITLSSPKAVSVLYAAGDDALREEIASAERAAVEATLRIIEHEIPLARRGHNGVRREHAKFTAAVFTHSEARPETHADGSVLASVQRHHHVCIPSIVERPDGTFGAVDSAGGIRSGKKLLGSVFRLQLATELERRNFAIVRADDGWRWSIAGVPDKVAKFFSARRSAIEAELAKAGLTSGEAPAVAAAITRKNRRTKDTVNAADRIAGWQEAIKDLGFDPSAIVEAAREAGREAAARDSAIVNAIIHSRMAALPSTLTESEATFERRHLLEVACNALVGTGVSVDQAVKEADALVQNRAIIELGTTRDGVVLSTPEMVATERKLVETAVNLALARVAAPDPNLVRRLCQENGLSQEQTEVALAATSGIRLVNILAPAGTGKSKLLGVVARSFEAAGYSPALGASPADTSQITVLPGASVVGASVAWRAAIDLGQSINVPSSAIDALLKRLDSRVAAGKPAFEGRTVLLIDESGLQSSPQLARILDHVSRESGKNNRCILVAVGEERQIRPLGPGHPVRLLREAIGASTLSQVHRQREAWAREAPQAFARGDAAAALKAFDEHGLIEFHDGLKPTVDALADAWQQARQGRPNERITVLTKTNAEARAVAAVLRNRLKREGVVGTRQVLLPAVDASGNPHTLPVAAGDTLIALRRVDRLGVVNGTPLVVEHVKVARLAKKVTITARRGDEIIQFTPEDIADGKGRVRLANGLVSTIFRAQGATVDQAFVLLNDRYDRHDSYVSASRARGDTRFFCSRSLDSSIRASSGDFHSEIDDTQRLDHLAQRLSRERVKTTTLDLIDVAEFAKAHIKRERNRQKELGHEL